MESGDLLLSYCNSVRIIRKRVMVTLKGIPSEEISLELGRKFLIWKKTFEILKIGLYISPVIFNLIEMFYVIPVCWLYWWKT